MRAAIYCRVSSTQQAKEGDSISAQLDALRKYIRKYSYECVGEFAGAMGRIIQRCTMMAPEKRYQTVLDLMEVL